MRNQTQNNTVGKHAPEFIPIQQRGPDPVFGLSRSSYYNLEKAGLVRLVRVRKPGNISGRVLIDCNSVRRYLASLNDGQKSATGSGVEA
jgi:hypothetical protein